MPETVLVVEDDPDVRDVMVAVVENEGHTAVPAESSDEALRLLRSGLQPCLILVDRTIPANGGGDFHTEQRADPKLATIPTIVVSEPFNLDQLSRLLKRHCMNNHRVA
jgi:two-component system, OmpR family, aerobic respiration control sensor histidine kinase ArcB